MDPDRVITLTDAAVLAGCSRKSLERRVERGSLVVTLDGEGKRAVRVADLLRAGLVCVMPAGAEAGMDPRRIADAEADAEAARIALSATEAALRRARDEVSVLRQRVMDAEARAAVAENDLTTLVLDRGNAQQQPSRVARGRLRLRTT